MTNHILFHGVLVPLDLHYLRIILFIVVIAGLVQLVRACAPPRHYCSNYWRLPTVDYQQLRSIRGDPARHWSGTDLLQTLVYAIGAAGGFTLVMVLFGAMREQLQQSNLPAAFEGTPIVNQRWINEPGLYGLSRTNTVISISVLTPAVFIALLTLL